MNKWMTSNRLKLNIDKTQFIWLGTRQQLAKVQCQTITLGTSAIPIPAEVMCLEVVLDSEMKFDAHIKRLSERGFYHHRQFRTIRRTITVDAAKTFINAFVTSHIDYCNAIFFHAAAEHLPSLQSLCSHSKCCLTKHLYNWSKLSFVLTVNVLLIIPKIWFVVLTILTLTRSLQIFPNHYTQIFFFINNF